MTKHNEKYINKIINLLQQGISPEEIAKKYKLSLSTIYNWKNQYLPIQNKFGSYTLREVSDLRRENERLKQMLEVLIKSPFIIGARRKDRMRYIHLIKEKREDMSEHALCDAFGIDYSTYSNYKKSLLHAPWFTKRHDILAKKVLEVYEDSNRTYGAAKIRVIIKKTYKHGLSVRYVGRLMRELGIMGATPVSSKGLGRREARERRKMENLLQMNFTIDAPNRVWVMDCKYIWVKNHKINLCVVIDLFARMVVGYHINIRGGESARHVIAAFKQAYGLRTPENGLILHTDRGSANRSRTLNKFLRTHSVRHSYSEKECPPENGVAESFFSHFTAEELAASGKIRPYHSVRETRESIEEYIERFNTKRIHEYNNYLTPEEAEKEYYQKKFGGGRDYKRLSDGDD